jgi:hypothetical protein
VVPLLLLLLPQPAAAMATPASPMIEIFRIMTLPPSCLTHFE